MTRETWATRVGFILAAVGSAVGLGNIWRFPWMTAENGGSAFLIVYLGIVLLVGVPGLLGEFVIGRRAKRNPAGALKKLSGSRAWELVGGFSVVTAVILLSFYSVVGGWILRYFLASPTGAYFESPGGYYDSIAFGTTGSVGFGLVFLVLTGIIVFAGVRRGIEVATKVMMPAIVALLLALAGWAFFQPNAMAGYDFYLGADWGYLQANFFDILPAAAGQALFTLSVGAGTMITYASYLGEDRSLPFDGSAIAVLNTFVGVLAGLVVFPLLFSFAPDAAGTSGPGALFVGIAGAFANLPSVGGIPTGILIATLFFGVVTLAALSSSISMLEIPVSFLVDEFGVERKYATGGMLALVSLTMTVNALRPPVFEFIAGTLVDLMLTAGLLAFLLFVGWVLGRDAIDEFAKGASDFGRALASPWLLAVGVLLPLFLLFTLLTGIFGALGMAGAIETWMTVVLSVALGLVAFAGLRGPTSVL
ncbi:sodium-dependent transporter [Haladaptatus sp. DYSN1]|uniref:sodium-dependent transporter n=1 Tax=unclassified Haladaptatus TaxID=2622732 RepID=UPI002406C516|nr:sodium-dependent transporter [Haladaptatus sp. DYSN1]